MLDISHASLPPKRISGAKHEWEYVIGLEVHAQIATNAKLFSGAATSFGAEPNSNVAFVDAGMPGMLPVINKECVAKAIKTGLALNAKINLYSVFDRKNYFYPDLPQGYQISQLYHPLIGNGEVTIDIDDQHARTIRIERIHLEQDAGKSIHDMAPDISFIDLNRTGIALMEIVSLPDIRSPEEAVAYFTKLRQIMRYIGSCDGNMQKGNLRADVNISVCKPGAYERYRESGDFSHLGTRCEIKNMNSFRFIHAAIEFEAQRQIALLEDGHKIAQQTRLYDSTQGITRSMRSKEEAHDYRYFPCPDLLPLRLEQSWIDELGATLPELPNAKKARFINNFGLNDYDANLLTAEADNAAYFERAAHNADPKLVANWIINELFGRLKKDNERPITKSPIAAEQLGELVSLITSGDISGKIAKDVFEIAYNEGSTPSSIIETRGLRQVTDMDAIERAVDRIITQNPKQVAKAKTNPKLAGWFVGQVMKATGGKANPKAVNMLVNKKLGF